MELSNDAQVQLSELMEIADGGELNLGGGRLQARELRMRATGQLDLAAGVAVIGLENAHPAPDSLWIGPEGVVRGGGMITGSVCNDGLVDVLPVGQLTIDGDYSNGSMLRLTFDSASRYSKLVVTGDVQLHGVIDFVFNFTPVTPATFDFLDATNISAAADFVISGVPPSRVLTGFGHGRLTVLPAPGTSRLLTIVATAVICRRRKDEQRR